MSTDIVSSTALRITCAKSELASALSVVSRAVSTRGAVQVLGGILLQAEDDKLTLSATDMEISIRTSLAGEAEGDASVVVPGRLLTDLVRLLPDDKVTLAYDEGDGVLAVTSGSHASRLNVYSAEDFPRLPPLDVDLQTVPGRRPTCGATSASRYAPRLAARKARNPTATASTRHTNTPPVSHLQTTLRTRRR